MNIFVLDKDPVKAAKMQCDKHVVKMIVESAQMLSTAHRMLDGKLLETRTKTGRKAKHYQLPDQRENILYKAVHFNHPSTVWTRETSANYKWHWEHFSALCDEYTHRYGKIHKTDSLLRDALSRIPNNIQIDDMSPIRLAMGASPECIDHNDPVGSYRRFYQTKQKRFKMVWTKREKPDWFVRNSELESC